MLLKSFSSFFKDVLLLEAVNKYQVKSIKQNKNTQEIDVLCELIKSGDTITLNLKDILLENKLKFFSVSDVLLLSKTINSTNTAVSQNINIKCDSNNSSYYNLIAVGFITCLLISNLAAIKICNIFGYTLPGGIIIFPLLYILNDILTEVYGFSASRKIIWVALLCNLTLSLFLYFVTYLPPSPYWNGQDSFKEIFSLSPKIFLASTVSYIVGELINACIISVLKLKFKGENFAFRAIFSTLIGSLLESIIFCNMAFFGILSINQLLKMALLLTTIKVIYEIIIIPITTKIVAFLKINEGKDVFEQPSIKGLIPFL